jgi:hypothetical protein
VFLDAEEPLLTPARRDARAGWLGRLREVAFCAVFIERRGSPPGLAPVAAAAAVSIEAAATSHTGGLGTSLVHDQLSAVQLILVELRDGSLSFIVAGHFDEAESAGTARGHVTHDTGALDGPGPAEQLG